MNDKELKDYSNDWMESYKDLMVYGVMVRKSTGAGGVTKRVDPRDVLKDFPDTVDLDGS